MELRPRLATALAYGIKSDTQLLGRETSRHDMAAFAFLHAAQSPALLRRIERPALPEDALRALGRALARTQVSDGMHVLVLGRVREDVIPQVADLGLQAEGAEWAIAAGIVGTRSRVLGAQRRLRARGGRGGARGGRGARRRRRTPLDGQGHHPAEGLPQALRRRDAQARAGRAARGLPEGDRAERLEAAIASAERQQLVRAEHALAGSAIADRAGARCTARCSRRTRRPASRAARRGACPPSPSRSPRSTCGSAARRGSAGPPGTTTGTAPQCGAQ